MQPSISIPYADDSLRKDKPFAQDMEQAAILCLAEARRRKPSLLRGASEQLQSISRLHYPLWAVPWNGRCIVIDGLNLLSTTLSYNRTPSVLDFTEDLRRSSSSFRDFMEILEKHENMFGEFVGKEAPFLSAIIGEVDVLKALSSLIEKAMTIERKPYSDTTLIYPRLDRIKVDEKAAGFLGEWRRLESDINGLQYTSRVVEEELERHKEKMLMELEQIWRDYENRISVMKKEVEKQVKQLAIERDRMLERARRFTVKAVVKLDAKEKRLRQRLQGLEWSLAETRNKKKTQKRKYPKRSTTRIDSRIASNEAAVKLVTSEIQQVLQLREKAQKDGEREAQRIEETYLSQATREMEKIEILEKSRNLETSEASEKIKKAEEISSTIEAQIANLVEQKTQDMHVLESRTLELKADELLLIGIPFYLVCYESRGKERMDIFSPVTVTTYEGAITKMKRALSFSLDARIQLLLNIRSPELNTKIFMNLQKSIEADQSVKNHVLEAAREANLLARPEFGESIVSGLSELEKEGWLNAKDKQDILDIYVHSFG
jgi:hypothetical protein